MAKPSYTIIFALGIVLISATSAGAQAPDHPIISEVYQESAVPGGPATTDLENVNTPNQEFIEIYLPPLADLSSALNKDALNLTLYDVEGDSSSPGISKVNLRVDLPTFDLDPSNGMTGLARPHNGIVVLGWVQYLGNPPVGLAGTSSSRIAMINGGVTSTSNFTFIPLNGDQFEGTYNFPLPVAVSHIDTISDPLTGKIEQGSGAYLLVNRDDPGYVEYCGITDPAGCNSSPNLATGTGLGVSCLLDAFAANDDSTFKVGDQPYMAPTGDNIDLEFVLPQGGAFSMLVPQVPEEGSGYQRILIDQIKTSEDGITGNEDPALDAATAYRATSNAGPFFPTPGYAAFSTSPGRLAVATTPLQVFQVLKDTQARPGLVAANIGGNFSIQTESTPGPTLDPSAMNASANQSLSLPFAQSEIAPYFDVETFSTTPLGHSEFISVELDASTPVPGSPPTTDPLHQREASLVAIDPTTGTDAGGQPFQGTALIALQGIPALDGVVNPFSQTSLGNSMRHDSVNFPDSRGNGASLADPVTDLSDPAVIEPMVATMPTDPLFFINPLGTGLDLVGVVLNSAEVASGARSYTNSFNASETLVQAREFYLPGTPTTGGFTPTERIHYADAKGAAGKLSNGLTDVITKRDFEVALIDSQLSPLGTLETGATDDFGIAVQVEEVGPGASASVGEIIFLSSMGGLEGADLDTLDVPPHENLLTVTYLDLDALNSVMGIETIDWVYVIDGSGNGEVDIVEVVTLSPGADADGDGVPDASDAFPNDPAEWADTDQDGTGNNADLDDDDDGVSDTEELAAGTDPLNPASFPLATFAAFNAGGGYQAYLADPANTDIRLADICDEASAFAHWRDIGYGEGRTFAAGELRTDNLDASPDPDYAIDGGFAWEYPGANTVVFITADAPKPSGWAGLPLLLERCQTFNIGSYYSAQAYSDINTDVRNAIDQGWVPSFQSVTDHYVKYGFKEGRLTSNEWTEAQVNAWNDPGYLSANPDVANYFQGAANSGWSLFGKYGFAHWINFGQYEGRSDGQGPTVPVSADPVSGGAQYAADCAFCHGASGAGTASGSPLVGCLNCQSTFEALENKIQATMPPTDPGACVDACAADTAAHILCSFNPGLAEGC